MHQVMDFGEVALAGAFLKPDQFQQEKKYPLRLCVCADCHAVQVIDKVAPEVMFHDYFYFSSSIGTLRNHFLDYAREVTDRFLNPSESTVLEFGCNDGVLLRPLADQGIRTVIGVDPATNVVTTIRDPRITIFNEFFTEDLARKVVERYGKVDVVMANNVYAHISDIQGTTRAIEQILGDNGVFVFEVHYLGKVINDMQYDMVYHEHLYYYSLVSAMKHFARYGMVVFDVKPVPIHAGSMRFYVAKKGSSHAKNVSPKVAALETEERERGFDRVDTFERYSEKIAAHKVALMTLLENLRRKGKRIAGYGASGRANTMIQYCGIGSQHLDFMIDDAPAKIGFCTPGSHLRIHSSSVLKQASRPDYVLIFAWSFFNEILGRNAEYLEAGGRLILPLPSISIHPAEIA
jgi:SAM-dependent methyltransferase